MESLAHNPTGDPSLLDVLRTRIHARVVILVVGFTTNAPSWSHRYIKSDRTDARYASVKLFRQQLIAELERIEQNPKVALTGPSVESRAESWLAGSSSRASRWRGVIDDVLSISVSEGLG